MKALLLALPLAAVSVLLSQDKSTPLPPIVESDSKWDPRDFFPIEIGNTWIWGGEGTDYSVKSVTDVTGGPDRQAITFESTSPKGAIQFYDDFVFEGGRLRGDTLTRFRGVLGVPFSCGDSNHPSDVFARGHDDGGNGADAGGVHRGVS